MNNRIQELAEQTGFGWDTKYHWYVGNEQLKRFAELIVQDCLGVLKRRFMGDLNREDMEVKRCIEDVKEHFGVEE